MAKIEGFPNLRQTYNYDCGASSLQSVLVYYGIFERLSRIMESAGTTETGTPIKGIVETAEKHGLEVVSKKMDIEELKSYIDRQTPVIVLIQAWTKKENVRWEEDWEDGHYVVLIGYDDEKLYFEDPSAFRPTYLTYQEFKERWHDIDTNGEKHLNHGIAVFGRERADLKEIIHID